MMRWLAAALLVPVLFASVTAAEPFPLLGTVIVTGGQHDLKNVLVSAALPAAKNLQYWGIRATEGQDQAKRTIRCEYLAGGLLGPTDARPELILLLPELKAGEQRTIELRQAPPPPGLRPPPPFGWQNAGADTIELRTGMPNPRPIASFTRFVFNPEATPKDKVLTNPTIKPYHHVFDAAGKTRLTNGPDGKYPHHRGIFFGFNQISYQGKKADVWHCRSGESQRAGKSATIDGGLLGLHRLNVGWHGADGVKFANEERELAFFPMTSGLLIEFRSRLTTDIADGVKLDGDPQHAGFHFRASSAVEAAAKQTYFLRPDGKGKEGEEKNWDPKTKKGPVNLPWDAMCFVLDGKRRTVLYLDQPDNPKEARQSERTYGRIGTYFEYMLTPAKPLFVRYRLWIQDGEMTAEQCEDLSRAFVEPVKVEVK